jgi:putative component of membrane protein insertase Oxa1/YidC/SpoIIIJ protein YidD
MKSNTLHIATLVFCVIFSLLTGLAAAQEDPTPDRSQQHEDGAAQTESNPVLKPLQLITGIISRADGDRCPMVPTCSAYSAQAIQKHGLLKGWIMTCDRLMRCGRDELRLSDMVLINGRKRSHDPVSNNDFWW